MSFDSNQRISQALLILTRPLLDYVGREMARHHGEGWRHYLSIARGGDRDRPDAYALLKTMIDYWPTVFRPVLKPGDRTSLSTAFEARNETSHAGGALDADRALRHLLGIKELAAAIGAKEAAKAIDPLVRQQMADASGTGAPAQPEPAPAASPVVVPAAPERPKLSLGSARPVAAAAMGLPLEEPRAAGGLKPWREVAPPHPDVLTSRGIDLDFAANLTTVVNGRAPQAYLDPREFFRVTYLTQGLCAVLRRALARLAKRGGEPVIGLQTGFGGGKTHTMLALYHLASAEEAHTLPGVGPLFADEGVEAIACRSRPFAFVGTEQGPDLPHGWAGDTAIRTPWGLLAWQMGGADGFARVRDADAAWTNPGSAALTEILEAAAPCLVLLDEVTAYARQLDGTRYEAFLSFIQSLTEAAKAVPGALVVGSLPESAIEVGGPHGQQVLDQLSKVFGRVGSPWAAAQGTEQFEIIRRRLFQALDQDGERAREATIKAFQAYYKRQSGEFPGDVTDAAYAERMRAAYPVHPELFRMLQEDWPNLDRFQRTRGALKLVAQIAYRLWQDETGAPLILPAHVPLTDPKVRAEVADPLLATYATVIEREVAGDASRPSLLERQVANFGRTRAPTRAATALFMMSAPFGPIQPGQPIARVRLACALPDDQPSVFGEALRRIQETSAYLYSEGDRYWFSTQPTLNQLAADRAKSFEPEVVDAEIERRLRDEERHRTPGGFPRLHFGLPDPTAVEEATEAALVAFGPAAPHDPKAPSAESLARRLAIDVVERRSGGQRIYRNRLVFLAADSVALEEVRRSVRQALAWKSICDEASGALQLTPNQARDAALRAEQADKAATHALRTAWKHLLWPVEAQTDAPEDAARGFAIDAVALANRGAQPLAQAAWAKARGDAVNDQLGVQILALDLAKVWPAERETLALSDLRDWYFRFPYLTRLRDATVLASAVGTALGRIDAAYGTARLTADGEGLRDITLDRPTTPDFAGGTVLIRRATALERIGAATPSPSSDAPGAPTAPTTTAGGTQPPLGDTPTPAAPRRFFMTVELDPSRPGPLVSQIAQSIIPELSRAPGSKVKITIDIEATSPSGYSDDVVSVVTDNAHTLKIGTAGFEPE